VKYSKQRELILKTLRQLDTHPTAEELHVLVKRNLPSISLGTVYRNLGQLVDSKLVRKVEVAGSSSVRYEAKGEEHCHLICTECGSIIDATPQMFETIDVKVKAEVGFTVNNHGIILQGICKECQAKRKKPS